MALSMREVEDSRARRVPGAGGALASAVVMAWAVAGLYRLRREDSFIVGLVKEIAHIIRAIGWPRRKR